MAIEGQPQFFKRTCVTWLLVLAPTFLEGNYLSIQKQLV